MFKKNDNTQLSFDEFHLSFGGALDPKNRWVILAGLMPWEKLESAYADKLSSENGRLAKTFRIALGSLIIKARHSYSDEETVEQIKENPYLQFFIGLDRFTHEAPFDPSLMVHFRKRLNLDDVNDINTLTDDFINKNKPDSNLHNDNEGNEPDQEKNNEGCLKIDATVAPADIRYPSDVSLLNEAREKSERLIDEICTQGAIEKPRTYRRKARKDYLYFAKKRKHSKKQIARSIKKQLQYLRRDLGHIDRLLEENRDIILNYRQLKTVWVIKELFRQQMEMYCERKKQIADRIVSISQPHVRPIVRGKAGKKVEFGAKISISEVNSICYLDRLSWDAYNEGLDLKVQIEEFKKRFGKYPALVCADTIYGNRENRKYMQERNIRFSGRALGRKKIITDENRLMIYADRKQKREDASKRNAVEGRFGVGKRKYSLDRIMMKLAQTSEMWVAMILFVMNLEVWARDFFCRLCFCFFDQLVKIVGRAMSWYSRYTCLPGFQIP